MSINEQILNIRENADDALALVMEWANCMEADINDKGEIWIAKPQRGHWLSEECKAEFISWCERQ